MTSSSRLSDVAPDLAACVDGGSLPSRRSGVADVRLEMVMMPMRDGVRLATDLYLPAQDKAPVIVVRTPYDRSREDRAFSAALLSLARRGYAVVSQDCRGTGGSEPDSWDYYMYEPNDGYDCIDWITRQPWYGGFIGSFGGSYVGQTQWCMATHPAMSATIPMVSGLGVAINTVHLHLFVNAYAKSVGKGANKVAIPTTQMEKVYEKETMAGGYFNEPLHMPLPEKVLARFPKARTLAPNDAKRWLWEQYCAMSCAERAAFVRDIFGVDAVSIVEVEALPAMFGQRISHDRHTLPYADVAAMCRSINAPALLRTGWYDWGLNDALDTWTVFRREAKPDVAKRTRMLITPHSHNTFGYKEGADKSPELLRATTQLEQAPLFMRWYEAVRDGKTDAWPAVIYYLMGANEWRVADDWPVPGATEKKLYLGSEGALIDTPKASPPDAYAYDPADPTPTIGGSIVSYVYPPGSCDVSGVQKRPDVLTYTTAPLERDLDVVGPIKLVLYASSSAVDTDFFGRLSDVFPDGRAIQLQNCGLRARYRNVDAPELLEPGRAYCFEIDMWATANRFKAGHRIRLDISSADFPRYDRNTNRGGQPGEPITARQTIFHDPDHPSHLVLSVLPGGAV